MILEQPIQQILSASQNILLVGAGGGYDLFLGLPLLFDLLEAGKTVHLASFSSSYLAGLDNAYQHPKIPNMYAINGACATPHEYCPEAWLSLWLYERLDYQPPIWCFDKSGIRPLVFAYQELLRTLQFDTLVLMDGGFDSLLRGDETSIGTPNEDLTSLGAAAHLSIPNSILLCSAFGAEMHDGISHAQVLKRMAELTREGAFLGSLALTQQSWECRLYEDALNYVFGNHIDEPSSYFQKVILASIQGEFGSKGENVWISPFTSLFWFFSLPVVAKTHLFLEYITHTTSLNDVENAIRKCRGSFVPQEWTPIPL